MYIGADFLSLGPLGFLMAAANILQAPGKPFAAVSPLSVQEFVKFPCFVSVCFLNS